MSAIVAFLVAKRYGPIAVQKENIRRLHSEKLVDQTITPWRNDPFRYCHVGVAFKGIGWGDFNTSLGEGGGVILGRAGRIWSQYELDMGMRNPIDPPYDYYKELRSHLESGFPNVLISWEQIKRKTEQLNEEIYTFLKELGNEIFLNPEGKPLDYFLYWNAEGNPPKLYVLLEDIVFQIWMELEGRVLGKSRSPYILPSTASRTIDFDGLSANIFELSWKHGHPASIFARTLTKENCETIRSRIIHLCDSTSNLEKVRSIINRKDSLRSKIEGFQGSLRDIKAQVDLGKNLGGNCSICSKS